MSVDATRWVIPQNVASQCFVVKWNPSFNPSHVCSGNLSYAHHCLSNAAFPNRAIFGIRPYVPAPMAYFSTNPPSYADTMTVCRKRVPLNSVWRGMDGELRAPPYRCTNMWEAYPGACVFRLRITLEFNGSVQTADHWISHPSLTAHFDTGVGGAMAKDGPIRTCVSLWLCLAEDRVE